MPGTLGNGQGVGQSTPPGFRCAQKRGPCGVGMYLTAGSSFSHTLCPPLSKGCPLQLLKIHSEPAPIPLTMATTLVLSTLSPVWALKGAPLYSFPAPSILPSICPHTLRDPMDTCSSVQNPLVVPSHPEQRAESSPWSPRPPS